MKEKEVQHTLGILFSGGTRQYVWNPESQPSQSNTLSSSLSILQTEQMTFCSSGSPGNFSSSGDMRRGVISKCIKSVVSISFSLCNRFSVGGPYLYLYLCRCFSFKTLAEELKGGCEPFMPSKRKKNWSKQLRPTRTPTPSSTLESRYFCPSSCRSLLFACKS